MLDKLLKASGFKESRELQSHCEYPWPHRHWELVPGVYYCSETLAVFLDSRNPKVNCPEFTRVTNAAQIVASVRHAFKRVGIGAPILFAVWVEFPKVPSDENG